MASTESSQRGLTKHPLAENPAVRIRESRPDPYHGLKGHAYIKARNLAPPVKRVQTSAHAINSEVSK